MPMMSDSPLCLLTDQHTQAGVKSLEVRGLLRNAFKAQFSSALTSLPRDNCFICEIVEFLVHVKLISCNQVICAFQLQGIPEMGHEISTVLSHEGKHRASEASRFLMYDS